VFGVMAFILAIVAAVVSITTFVSVWCFYAAILSLLVYLHFSGPMQACRHPAAAARPRHRSTQDAHGYARWKNKPVTTRHRAGPAAARGTAPRSAGRRQPGAGPSALPAG
jgi:hypothetical protein